MRRFALLLFAFALPALPATASPREWVAANREAILAEFTALLAIPNVAANRADIRIIATI